MDENAARFTTVDGWEFPDIDPEELEERLAERDALKPDTGRVREALGLADAKGARPR